VSETDDERRRAEIGQRLAGNADNLELINSELAGRLDRLGDSGTKVDTKVVFLLGFIATAVQFLASRSPAPVLGGLAYAAYAAAFGLGVPALALTYYRDLDPRTLLDEYASRRRGETLLDLCALRVNAYEANLERHRHKSRWWWRSFIATIVAVILSVAAIVHTGGHDNAAARQHGPASAASAGRSRGPAGENGRYAPG
jgi:hypothetical protein